MRLKLRCSREESGKLGPAVGKLTWTSLSTNFNLRNHCDVTSDVILYTLPWSSQTVRRLERVSQVSVGLKGCSMVKEKEYGGNEGKWAIRI